MLWRAIRVAVRPYGWVAVDLFGDRDSWVAHPDLRFWTRPEAVALFDGWTIVGIDEEDRDGPAFSGLKHWHVFPVIAACPHSRHHE